MTPWEVAEIAVSGPVAIPTCDAPPPAVSKNTRSPAWICDFETDEPTPYCAQDVRGSEMPAFLNTYCVKPEQSKPEGVVPPEAYGVPISDCATPTTLEALLPVDVPLPEGALVAEGSIPAACSTCASGLPSAGSPFAASKRFSAAADCGPHSPSAVTPSLACSCLVAALESETAGGAVVERCLTVAPGVEEPRCSAAVVCGPTRPTGGRPCARWNALTARSVCGPNSPSAVMPSAVWSAFTDAPEEPSDRFSEYVGAAIAVPAPPVATAATPPVKATVATARLIRAVCTSPKRARRTVR